jgi:hypothetical protein
LAQALCLLTYSPYKIYNGIARNLISLAYSEHFKLDRRYEWLDVWR